MERKRKGNRSIFRLRKIDLFPFFFLGILLCTLGCGSSNSRVDPIWTVMVYMAGDNNLSPDLLKDLEEMEAVGSTGRVNVVVQIDTLLAGTTRRLLVKSGSSSLLEDLGEQNMASPQTLRDFVVWAKTRFPATRNALILSSHGDGLAKRIPHWTDSTRAKILQDDTDGVSCCLSNTLVREALEDTGVYFDLLGFDASQMGQVETAYEFRNVADILVFSQETGEANGWDYTAILRTLTDKPSMEGEGLAGVIVDSYRAFYEQVFYPEHPEYPEEKKYLTVSAIRLGSPINDLSVEIDRLSELLIECITSQEPEVRGPLLDTIGAAREETQELNPLTTPYVYVDLMDLMKNLDTRLKGQLDPPLILRQIEEKTSAILAMKDDAILSGYHGPARPDSNGLSIVFFKLPVAKEYPAYYDIYKNFDPYTGQGSQVQFFHDTRWDEFLLTYYQEKGLLDAS